MRAPPDGVSEREVVAAVAEGWGLDVAGAEYAPVGGGSYHWRVDGDGRRWFVTVDDLDRKGWLGADREAVFAGLRAAFDAALGLRDGCGLEFVLGPVPSLDGESLRWVGPRHSVAVFPLVEGSVVSSGQGLTPGAGGELGRMLARLHATPPVARPCALQPPERGDLERAMDELDREWAGGPLAEPARALLARGAAGVRRLLETFDDLAARVAARGVEPVVTHGEPHAGNVLRTPGGGLLLIDWDTVGLGPPERDLWLVDADARSGRDVDPDAMRLYELRWWLNDISSYLAVLRRPHIRTADTEHALRVLGTLTPSPRGGGQGGGTLR